MCSHFSFFTSRTVDEASFDGVVYISGCSFLLKENAFGVRLNLFSSSGMRHTVYALALQAHSVESDNISVIHLYLFILRQMENLIEIKISYSAIFSYGTSRVLFSSLESVVLNGWTRILHKTICVRCSDILSLTQCAESALYWYD